MLELVRRMKGYVRFRVLGEGGESFLNEAADREIPLWDVYREQGMLMACCPAGAYRTAAAAARQTGVRLRLGRKYGLPFWLVRLRRRPGPAVGLVVFAAVQAVLSSFIWQVEVVGAVQLPAAEVLRAAESIGIYAGMPKSEVAVRAAQHGLLQAVPELSWAAFNEIGCRIEIQVHERVQQPEILPSDVPCNLIARIPGVILRTQAEDGFAVVQAGDAVQAGDLLVEGLRVDAHQGTVLHHAHGPVYAVTAHTFTVEQPMVYAEVTDTGHTVVRRRWKAFGVSLPVTLNAAPGAGYRRDYTETPVELLGVRLPVTICTETWVQQDTRQVACTEEEALTLARQKLSRRVRAELPEVQILSAEESVAVQGGTVLLTRTLTCVEDIAVQMPIEMDEQGIPDADYRHSG